MPLTIFNKKEIATIISQKKQNQHCRKQNGNDDRL